MFVTLLVFHSGISGNVDNEVQSGSICCISVTSFVFHFEISDIDIIEEQLKNNIQFILVTLLLFN